MTLTTKDAETLADEVWTEGEPNEAEVALIRRILASDWMKRREAEVRAEALREAMSGASFGSLGAAIHKFRCTDPDCHHWDDLAYFTPRDNDAASACHNWLRDRAAALAEEGDDDEWHEAVARDMDARWDQ